MLFLMLLFALFHTGLMAMEYEVQLDHEKVCVARAKILPHEEIGLHRDVCPQVVIALQGGTIHRLEANGSTNAVLFPTGIPVFRPMDPPHELHRSVNPTDHPIELMIIQLKEEMRMRSLEQVGKDYMALLERIGTKQDLSHAPEVERSFASSCKKLVNGALWYEGREKFLPQLLKTGKEIGVWGIQPLDVIPGADGKTVVVRFLVTSKVKGTWNTLVILRCNETFQITEINEVFNNYEGPTRPA